MKVLKLTTQFKKDLKKYKHQQSKLDALEEVLKKLRKGETLPPFLIIGVWRGRGRRRCIPDI